MATTREIEALRTASEVIDSFARAVRTGEMPDIAAEDLTALADELRLTAEAAGSRTFEGEFLDDAESNQGEG